MTRTPFTTQAPRVDGPPPKTPAMIADRRLYLDETKRLLVEERAVEARWLLAPAGGAISGDDVDRLGLTTVDGCVSQMPRAARSIAEEKMSAPEGDKMLRPDENKGRGRK